MAKGRGKPPDPIPDILSTKDSGELTAEDRSVGVVPGGTVLLSKKKNSWKIFSKVFDIFLVKRI